MTNLRRCHDRHYAAQSDVSEVTYNTDSSASTKSTRQLIASAAPATGASCDPLARTILARTTIVISNSIQRAYDSSGTSIEHMGVDHGGSDISMAKQLLHCPDVVSALKKMSGKGVAEGVATGMLVDSGPQDSVPDSSLNK